MGNLWERIKRWPLWAKIAVPAVALILAVGAVGAVAGEDESESAPETTTTTVERSTTSSRVTTTSTSTTTTAVPRNATYTITVALSGGPASFCNPTYPTETVILANGQVTFQTPTDARTFPVNSDGTFTGDFSPPSEGDPTTLAAVHVEGHLDARTITGTATIVDTGTTCEHTFNGTAA